MEQKQKKQTDNFLFTINSVSPKADPPENALHLSSEAVMTAAYSSRQY